MREDLLTKLESKIYIFSVDVFSFVKTLADRNISNPNTTALTKTSNRLYTKFLDIFESAPGDLKKIVSECREMASECAIILDKIEVEKKMLNERIDLLIESKEILKQLDEIS